MEKKMIMVEREIFQLDGKEYFSYFIKGMVRGREVKVKLTPPDIGGYAVLDIVYASSDKAELTLTPYEVKGEDGKVISGNSYNVRSIDEDGLIYECKIKPARTSDKNLLEMLLRA